MSSLFRLFMRIMWLLNFKFSQKWSARNVYFILSLLFYLSAQPSAPSIEKDGKTSFNGSIVGPFYEGAALNLECETFGGKPTPEVSWFKVSIGCKCYLG